MIPPVLLAFSCCAAVAPEGAEPVAESTVEPLDDSRLADAWVFADQGIRIRAGEWDRQLRRDEDARLGFDVGGGLLDGQLRLDAAGDVFWDLDGPDRAGLASVHGERVVDPLLYQLSLSTGGGPVLDRASVGRVSVDEGWPVTLDGAALSLRPLGNFGEDVAFGVRHLRVFFSAGRTVHFYATDDKDPAEAERLALSGGVEIPAQDFFRVQLDGRALLDPALHQDGSVGATVFLRAAQVAQAKLWTRSLNDQLMHVGGRVQLGAPVGATLNSWGADVSAEVQPTTLDENVLDVDPFIAVLGESLPHWRARTDAFGAVDVLGMRSELHLGAMGRANLVDREQQFNRNSGRVYALGALSDVLIEGLFLEADAALDAALAPQEEAPFDDGRVALGGSCGYQRHGLRLELGTAWDRYKINYYRDVEEIADVRSVFARVRIPLTQHLQLRVDGNVELFDRTLYTVGVTLAEQWEVMP